jgi:NAD(P)-dependent dehydrogenase (short-subunit alcohol dehydrogenase family)
LISTRRSPQLRPLRSLQEVDAFPRIVPISPAMAGVLGDFGTVDVLVNNVGWSGRLGYFLTIEPERWDRAYQLNLRSMFNMTREVLPTMVAAKRGAIVSIASDAGFGMTYVSEYGAMKAGVMAFSRSIAIEYGRYGIRSNAVAPGIVMERRRSRFSRRNPR